MRYPHEVSMLVCLPECIYSDPSKVEGGLRVCFGILERRLGSLDY